MASVWQEFVDTIDSWISVDDGLFWTDFRALMALPMMPFVAIAALADLASTAANVAILPLVLFEVWWAIFLFRRRAAKKRRWTEPQRFSDDTNGY